MQTLISFGWRNQSHSRKSLVSTSMSRRIFRISPGPMSLPFVDRDRRAATVGMFKLPMAAFGLSQKLEAHLFQGTNQDARLDVWQIGVAHTITSTWRTPMISVCRGTGLPVALKSSRHSEITSMMFSITSS